MFWIGYGLAATCGGLVAASLTSGRWWWVVTGAGIGGISWVLIVIPAERHR
jgi:hypothetical protein